MKTTQIIIRILQSILFLLITGWINAQTLTIQGTVIASDDRSLVTGANVYIKGTATGTVTDVDGRFILSANVGDIIVISFIGYLSEEITVDVSTNNLTIQLGPEMVTMDQIVVVGYGTQKKSDLTGAVVTVTGEDLNRKPVATFEQAIQGLAPGVTVVSNSGAPGEGANINIRGVGSANNNKPLYVIDGVPVDGPGAVNPADIESISILKDAASAAIYGSRGANGVILITTKKGKKGIHVTAEMQFGIQKEWRRLDLLNSEQYAMYVNELNYNAGGTMPPATVDPFNQPYNTDWQDAMFRSAPINKHNLSVSGGNNTANFNLSAGYFNQQGIMIGTGYEKYNIRLNSEVKWKKFRFGENIALTNSTRNNEVNDVGGRSQIERMLTMTPNLPVYDTANLGGFGGPVGINDHDAVNPVGVAEMYKSINKTKGVMGSLFGEVELIEGLKYKLTFGFDIFDQENSFYEPAYSMGDYQRVGEPKKDTTFNKKRYTLIENLLTYTKTFHNHQFTLMAGYTVEQDDWRTQGNASTYYPETDTTIFTPGAKNLYEKNLISYLGRLNYSFADRYLLQTTIRRDASSNFGPKNQWGVFPSFSAGWVVSKENFLQVAPFISFLKIRGSWGKVGNQDVGAYQFESLLNPYQRYVFNDSIVDGTGPRRFPNEAIKWESSAQSNIGIDLSLLKNKVNITTEYYNNVTEDILIPVTMPASNGTTDFPDQNAGSVRNRGFEFMLNYRNYDKKFKYSVTGNLATIDNEVLKTGITGQPIVGGGSELGTVTRMAIGQPIGVFYGYVTDGIYKENDVIDPVFAPDAKVGDIRFKDLSGPDGVPDGILSEYDMTFIGSPIPKISYGFNFTAEYNNFDFSFTFQGVHGNKIYRETSLWTEGMYSNFNASTDVLNRYRPQDISITTGTVTVEYPANTNTSMPWAVRADPNKNAFNFSDRFIEDGSYLRLKDISLGYTIPNRIADKIKANRLRVYIIGLNVLTFTKYKGYDPEIGFDNQTKDENRIRNLNVGIDNGYYPQARAFLGGIQLSF